MKPQHLDPRVQELSAALTKEFTDKGLIVTAGWHSFRVMVIPKDAPQIQLDEMEKAFMAGAAHLFASIMTMLDSGEEPTDRDLNRMDLIAAELNTFNDKIVAEIETKGRA